MDLIAKKPMTYASRRLRVGEPFQARTVHHGRVLIAIGKAGKPTGTKPVPAPPATPPVVDGDAAAKTGALRSEYEEVFGNRPFNGWDADTLAAKIAEKRAAE